MRQGGDDLLLGTRLPRVAIPAAWRGRVGDYRLMDRGADAEILSGLRLRLSEDRLLLDIQAEGGSLTLAVQPHDDREALLPGKLAGFGERLRARRGAGEEILTDSGYGFGKRRAGAR